MTKEELFRKYEAVKKRLKFFVETEEPLLEAVDENSNDYKGLIARGEWVLNTGRGPAVSSLSVALELINHKFLPKDKNEEWVSWMLTNYYALRNVKYSVKFPDFISRGVFQDVSFAVRHNISGKRILDRHLFATSDQKKEVAKMFWATVEALKILDRSKLAGQTSLGYFEKQFSKWVNLRSELEPQWKPTFGEVREFVLNKFDKVCRLAQGTDDGQNRKIKMEWFFNVFGNTDIVKSRSGEYFIYNAHLEPKPEGFGIAAWIWNIIMYSWDREPQEVLKEVFDWVNVFLEGKDRKEHMPGILANLIERCLAALVVDLPLKRSPYDDLSDEAIEKSRKNFSYVLDTLVEVKI